MMNVWRLDPEQTQELPPVELVYDGKKVTKRVVITNTKKVGQYLVVEDVVGAYHIFLASGGLVDETSPLERKEEYGSDPI